MARALTSKEQEDLDRMFSGDSKSGFNLTNGSEFTGGSPSSNMTASTGSTGSGENAQGKGTGFINAQEYLKANSGKGLDLAKTLGQDADKSNSSLVSGAEKVLGYKPERIKALPSYEEAMQNHYNKDYSDLTDDQKITNLLTDQAYWVESKDRIKDHSYDSDRQKEELSGLYNDITKTGGSKANAEKYNDAFKTTAEGANLRTALIKDSAKTKGINSYSDNAAAFDSMFMEAEGAGEFSDKQKALQANLDKYFTFKQGNRNIGKAFDETKAEIDSRAEAAKEYRDNVASSSDEEISRIDKEIAAIRDRQAKAKAKAEEEERIREEEKAAAASQPPVDWYTGDPYYTPDDMSRDIVDNSKPITENPVVDFIQGLDSVDEIKGRTKVKLPKW